MNFVPYASVYEGAYTGVRMQGCVCRGAYTGVRMQECVCRGAYAGVRMQGLVCRGAYTCDLRVRMQGCVYM